jgi:hypothetical protein
LSKQKRDNKLGLICPMFSLLTRFKFIVDWDWWFWIKVFRVLSNISGLYFLKSHIHIDDNKQKVIARHTVKFLSILEVQLTLMGFLVSVHGWIWSLQLTWVEFFGEQVWNSNYRHLPPNPYSVGVLIQEDIAAHALHSDWLLIYGQYCISQGWVFFSVVILILFWLRCQCWEKRT